MKGRVVTVAKLNKIQASINKWGRNVTYKVEQEFLQTKAIISPFQLKNKNFIDDNMTKLGMVNENYYIYVGLPTQNLLPKVNETIDCEGDLFKVQKCEKVYLGDSILYIWAVLKSCDEGELI